MDLAVLRDKAYMTELAVLFALHRDPTLKLTGVADQLGVTVQAVSNYARAMVEQGLLEEGTHRVTPEGVQELHERLERVKRAVDGAYRRLRVITETAAVAGADLAAGERVRLVMEDGLLTAYPVEGTEDDAGDAAGDEESRGSTGVAAAEAQEGGTVHVTDLEGIVEITPGRVHVVRVPVPPDGKRVRAALDDRGVAWDRVAGLGTEAQLLARRMDAPLLEFAAADAAFEAAQLGLDVLLLATPDRVRDAVATLEARNDGALIPVRYELLEVG